MTGGSPEAVVSFAWALYIITPLAVVLFLTTFLVNLYQAADRSWFMRFCHVAQWPSFGLVLVCVVLTARYF
ncbi:hypothetical protein JANAI62_33670 [Jannaschia pagri]|uniref:Protein AaeX n=1 Tax=Jannaschia pagri TaxID=2829797 RepID=A0ABQ4NQQ3_9RHOB|nr:MULTISPECIES: hypothetical protein [unclassified Jannaschia]GIT92909.1 hypothetical protein JANAI61_33670 [Jannaschia sp. AI_61]GIT96744.1 hypothetical protein JANAI62_33670 [Jannaschia sp. AI_62]